MWIFTKAGFVSIVEHRADYGLVMIRSRASIDLQRIASEYFMGVGQIIRTPNADYPFRFVTSKSELRDALGRAVDQITYDNFKAAAFEADDENARLRTEVYGNVWVEVRRLEELNVHNVNDARVARP